MNRSRASLWIALAAVPVLFWLGQTVAPQKMEHEFVEYSRPFHAFVCAGEIARGGGNPYRVEPLLSCEHRASVPAAVREPEGVVEPAPLPGYALAFFSLFSGLPYVTAALIWGALLIMSLVVATWALARITSFPSYAIAAALLPNAAYGSALQGELPPLCIAALSVSALLLAQKRFAWAAIAASLAMAEPHVGLAACAGLFVFAPKARWTLLACAVVFAAASLAMLGIDGNIEYFRAALPAQARSELLAPDQYSLTWVLHAFGVSDNAALLAGSLAYPAMLAAGLLLARRWASQLRSPELHVLVPAAVVLIGGVFIHDIQMVLALPAALVIADRIAVNRAVAVAGVALIAIPWGALDGLHFQAYISLVLVLLLALETRLGASMRGALIAAGALAVILVSLHVPPDDVMVAPPVFIEPAANAATNWQRYIEANARPITLAAIERKLLLWSGFVAIAFAVASSEKALAEPADGNESGQTGPYPATS
jgi:hypothetical protein